MSTDRVDSYFDVIPDDKSIDKHRLYSRAASSSITTCSTTSRNYKCPNCGGEFNQWAKRYYKYNEDGSRQLTSSRVGAKEQQCPFCGMAKFSYDESETQEDD
jgi:predicted RNA-binding Zn-ribbon protein involved in translation (DUF1610 family)